MSNNNLPVIAIDGPAGAGKSTIAKELAERLNIPYLDTGAMYRALTYWALQHQVEIDDPEGLRDLYKEIVMDVRFAQGKQEIYIDETDVTPYLRLKDVSELVSPLSAHPFIRELMVKKQREIAARNGIVLDGRDIGTVVLPDAPLKIFLTASLEERTRRRHLDFANLGISMDFEQLKEEIAARDLRDSTREIAPLEQAKDACLVDTTNLNIEEVVDLIIALLKQKNLLPEGNCL